jgi:indolepyruvate ferredoxin oxidoreductase
MVENFIEASDEANPLPLPPNRTSKKPDFSLDAKYLQEEGLILLSGVHALIRIPLDQHRADRRNGLNTAAFISGYRGSPVGGLDMLLQDNAEILRKHHVVFQPGLNEDLGATAVFGSQMANLLPNPKYDGVLGMWYGKAPGFDRSGDAFKHANYAGVGRHGGVLAISGDDPNAKSSTLPSATEMAMYDSMMPVLFPGNVQEVIDLGRIGFELSRYSGLWVGFKIVTNVADEYSSVEVSPDRIIIQDPGFVYKNKPWQHSQNAHLLTPYTLTTEREIMEGRWEAARLFGVANGLNPVMVQSSHDTIGIIAPGKTYYDVRQAFHELGLGDSELREYGIRLMKVNFLAPMDGGAIREFARGLEEIFIIEEKRAFLELFVRDALYNLAERPRIVGKRDENDKPLVQQHGELDSDEILRLLLKRLKHHLPADVINERLQTLDAPGLPISIPLIPVDAKRTPYYCSGCPHNTSTMNVPEGSLVGGGIGCHTMTILMDRSKEGIIGITQMGGEGVQWVGAAPFSETEHIFQNLGDGTFFHSGSLAIRQAVAAKAHITYKILWNSAVAMTGGQNVDGGMSLPQVTHLLKTEGVKRIIITTPTPDEYDPHINWAEGVEIWHRDRIEEAQIALRDTQGVTALIHDQECAAELRRKRRRGLVDEPPLRVFINEAVCEGCGDCGVKSNCLSVFPVDTEHGRKTQIHQSSCNKDYSCLKGDCPAFMTVIPNEDDLKKEKKAIYEVDVELPEPTTVTQGESNLYMMGVGGTGVVTINQIIATAAVIDGKHVTSLDQTGLSQKGGPVVSHLKIMDSAFEGANKISLRSADAYIAFDLLTATDLKNLDHATPGRTVAIVSTSEVPTGGMVSNTAVRYPGTNPLVRVIESHTRKDQNVYFDAISLSELLFGSHMPANIMVIGAAYQRGLIPISAAAIERAVELNGVAVKANINAFRVGRRIVIEPEWVETLKSKRAGDLQYEYEITPEAQALIDTVGAEGELLRLLQIRVPDLIEYQNVSYAKTYVDFVTKVINREKLVAPGATRLSEAVARYMYKLMAYKDEYEVARLSLKPSLSEELRTQFGENAQVRYMLHPPILRMMGLKKKLALGKWFDNFYGLLRQMKGLRGTPLDIFGYAKVRRVERELIRQYRGLIEEAINGLTPENYDDAVKLAELPDMIRGYEDVKLRNVEKFWQAVEALQTTSRAEVLS